MIFQTEISLTPFPRGFHLITNHIVKALGTLPATGLLNVFIHHTSAGICINENADPSVLKDMETSFNRIAPEGLSSYTHTMEGDDDMPAHVKSVITGVSLTIPITGSRLKLGTWQGIYLCEFRNHGGARILTLTIYS
ncbi:MAG TPA: secondary thiamine-phosphate synthase enzyme YjbQ [Bacteroidales bacterium]|nr:secondary thiamine-phosphate synthase enzyme YjbQ [Bacteroidales bacterium]